MKLRPGVTVAALATATLTALTTLTAPTAPAAPGPARAAEEPSSPVALTGAPVVEVGSYDGFLYGDIGLNLLARDQAFEVRAHRTKWIDQIETYWQSPNGPVQIPAGPNDRWDALDNFIVLEIRRAKDGELVRTRRLDVCLNQWNTQRSHPDAPLRSPYPMWCPANPFTKGSVQGIQEGWISNIDISESRLRLPRGRYDVTARIANRFVSTLGIAPADARRKYRLVVTKPSDDDYYYGRRDHGTTSTRLRPAAVKPRAKQAGAPTDAVPDLRSLPAFSMRLSPNKKYLRFSATVWNAGDGPLVVDGFRRGTQDVMDAFQYFIDSEGNQTGYRQVGTMIWHKAPSHNHWHFKDFAKYSLLNADKTEVVVSRKESFCLANTDAVDYTVPGADWQPENTDLHTSCGDQSSISLREVLSPGSGDTYEQFRAGQAFRVDNLPNGIYYIAVEGNPNRNLVESNTGNNRALRKVKLSGKGANRKLSFYRVGIIDDRGYGSEEH
ncbi:lysyl oxidase [Nocardioides sp. J9]|uniref:lysyl oxidase family protein n=1 Tax=Nocardioides sp. J9 TaxID=935844 RepID=UPI0011A87D17|nr:lysyl oxidase family protein [Nocardioides sp. J9]TWG99583.1 lysyl oxidase [Nocardioides sp. J9]